MSTNALLTRTKAAPRGPRTTAIRAAAAALLVATGVSACGDKAGDPTTGTYTVEFPSVAAAVASDTLQILVFDVSSDKRVTLCGELLQRRRNREALPARLVEGPATRVCDARTGKGSITVGYGDRAFLAVTVRDGQDFLLGCAIQNVGDGDAPAKIYLALASARVTVSGDKPPTACTSLSEFCDGRCK